MDVADRGNKIAELEKLAKSVLKVKNESIPRRPIVVEFCGSPKSGKSTCINSLDLFLRRNNFRTRVLTERASVCPIRDKHDANFNIWTACSAIAELAEILSNSAKDYDVVILDRGIFDALCWFSWLRANNSLDHDDYTGLKTFLLMSKWRRAIDLVYVFSADPTESLKREYANLMTSKAGRIMNKSTLRSYHASIVNVTKEYKAMFQNILDIDTTNIDIDSANYEVTKNALDILRGHLMERIGYVERAALNESLPESFPFLESGIQKLELKYDYRETIENRNDAVQPIPILIITNRNRDRIFVVKKNKKNSHEHSPEGGKLLVYLGGHSRIEDQFGKSDISLISVTKESLKREIKEETGINYVPPIEDDNPLCIWSKNNTRSEKHLAIVYEMTVTESEMRIKLDSNEFMVASNTLSGSFMDVEELSMRANELEDWSKIILKEMFGVTSSGTGDLFA